MDSNDFEAQVLLSRSTGLPSFLGKCTCEISTKVPEITGEKYRLLCAARGMTVSEALRDFMLVQTEGYEEVERMRKNQLRVAAGMPPEGAPTQAQQEVSR